MNDKELFVKIQEAIADVLDIDTDEIQMESKILSDLGAESIDMLDIASELEKIINKEVDLAKLRALLPTDKAMVVGDLVKFLKSL
ncbi:MAG: hypothetical protein A2504_00890 [Bdellovibrionales bacterium RIFOXYD12_FULL_39_22]|nr:MAG: hypothetical protein A2385_03510 [Bdellovibrionales bacterium RIFOXYB1_FULL_39_21]OFZ42605.1 MAG: hypothetical protein A2485_09795 [Bdellovibrionales bacterium RIFOXYC12_FULL_39_17]OFZ47127.1 MAG: hypothetical protein A2404_15500 [Bdellovibrionales bacterium RIFOXYC1_FULL_39_130]OFZ75375.1 MAG: hypothetical protein A2560_14275 [Bdellovibrionales bacterium RIFOXYD1_FULL_39_84]OFZ75513.1 MAG: hypothetical protein A2451_00545 [Bdellovibrionales bacterium RIFOXYC2_FULL_39_8]OFZ93326.1 MAG: